MNRARRRALERFGIPVVIGAGWCEDCGAPHCPLCGAECPECRCCGEFNCEACEVYVLPDPGNPEARPGVGGGARSRVPPKPRRTAGRGSRRDDLQNGA